MRSVVRLIFRLYPRVWRERYGAEFAALLDETGTDWRIALDVFNGAVLMQVRHWKMAGPAALLAAVALAMAAWYAGQRTYVSPGTHLILRQDSDFGGVLGFLVLVAVVVGTLIAGVLWWSGKSREAVRTLRTTAACFGAYVAAVIAVSLVTPRTVVSIGDSYCWDLLCTSIQQVNTVSRGENVSYTAGVRVFSDAHRVKASADPRSFYLVDDRGRRHPLTATPAGLTVWPGESVNTSISFVAPAGVQELYLTRDFPVLPWLPLYLGSDISLFHRRTLLRVL
jgi:hypothetical protein